MSHPLRVLFLTHRLPYAPNKGDRARALNTLRLLRGSMEVDLVSFVHDEREAAHVEDLRPLAASVAAVRVPRLRNLLRGLGAVAATEVPLTHALLDAPSMPAVLARLVAERPPDVILAYCSSMARFAVAPPLERFPLVLDMMDVDSEKWRTYARKSRAPMRWVYAREARCLSRFEAVAARRARVTLVVNDRERQALERLAPGAAVRVLEIGVDVARSAPPGPPAEHPSVVFCGAMSYKPNAEAAVWLAREVWPHVRARRPDAHLWLVGAEPGARVRALGSSRDGIDVTGTVPDVKPYLWNAAVAVAPLLTARGVQTKVLEAVAAQLPVVVTPAVQEGLPPEVLPACRVASSARDFASCVADLLERTGAERRTLATRAEIASLGWESRTRPLVGMLMEAAGVVQ